MQKKNKNILLINKTLKTLIFLISNCCFFFNVSILVLKKNKQQRSNETSTTNKQIKINNELKVLKTNLLTLVSQTNWTAKCHCTKNEDLQKQNIIERGMYF